MVCFLHNFTTSVPLIDSKDVKVFRNNNISSAIMNDEKVLWGRNVGPYNLIFKPYNCQNNFNNGLFCSKRRRTNDSAL